MKQYGDAVAVFQKVAQQYTVVLQCRELIPPFFHDDKTSNETRSSQTTLASQRCCKTTLRCMIAGENHCNPSNTLAMKAEQIKVSAHNCFQQSGKFVNVWKFLLWPVIYKIRGKVTESCWFTGSSFPKEKFTLCEQCVEVSLEVYSLRDRACCSESIIHVKGCLHD